MLNESSTKTNNTDESASIKPRGLRFWLIMLALTVSGLLAALESTVVGTALPSITSDLGGGEKYVWVTIAYFLTM